MMIDVRARGFLGTRFQMKSFLISRWCENQTGSAARVPLPARPATPAPARQPPPPRAAATGRGGRGSGPWVAPRAGPPLAPDSRGNGLEAAVPVEALDSPRSSLPVPRSSARWF